MYSQLSSISGGHLLHPQPQNEPCHGDKDPLDKEWFMTIKQKEHFYYVYVSCTRITNVLYLFTAEHLEHNCMFYIFLLRRVLECK